MFYPKELFPQRILLHVKNKYCLRFHYYSTQISNYSQLKKYEQLNKINIDLKIWVAIHKQTIIKMVSFRTTSPRKRTVTGNVSYFQTCTSAASWKSESCFSAASRVPCSLASTTCSASATMPVRERLAEGARPSSVFSSCQWPSSSEPLLLLRVWSVYQQLLKYRCQAWTSLVYFQFLQP